MKMAESKIIFLGTGGGRIVVANQIAATGGFVIQLHGYQIHVDPGPGALVRAKQFGVKVPKTDIIYVTHHHIDHVNDLNAIVDAITLGGINKKGILISTPTVINGSEKELAWIQPFYKEKLKQCIAAKPGDAVNIGQLKFIATKTKHDIKENIGMRIDAPDISIGHTSDTCFFPELTEEFKGVTVLIMNVLRPGKDHWKTHFCSEDAINLINAVRPELAIIQHYGAKMLRSSPIYEAREIQRRTGVRTIAAVDGTKIDISGLRR